MYNLYLLNIQIVYFPKLKFLSLISLFMIYGVSSFVSEIHFSTPLISLFLVYLLIMCFVIYLPCCMYLMGLALKSWILGNFAQWSALNFWECLVPRHFFTASFSVHGCTFIVFHPRTID